jgi:mannosyltransferase
MQAARPPITPLVRSRAAWLAVGCAVLLGVAFRLHARSDLWLDEALSVNIAALPLGDLLEQLKVETHPPLYYLLLHGWMAAFGEGDVAVRSLSGVFALATIPLFWVAARRFGGRPTAVAGTVLLATSPFAVRYATEARMYSLATLLVVAGWLAVRSAAERPTGRRLAAVALCSGLLALTHYWSFYLLAALGLYLLVRWWREKDATHLKVLGGIAAGAVLFLPWLPSFLEQMSGSGTPWGQPDRPTTIFAITFTDWGGGPNGEAQFLAIGILLLFMLGLFGRAVSGALIELDLRTHALARPEAIVGLGTLVIATAAGYATGSAYASRYTAVIFPIILLVAALGAGMIQDARIRAGVLVALALLGLVGSVRNFRSPRTQGGSIGAYITTHGQPGDVVAFCPDQLGPSTMRHVPDDRIGMSFPEGTDPRFVDWVDYEARMAAGKPKEFAAKVAEAAGADSTIWFVWSGGYRTLGLKCERTVNEIEKLRPGGTPVLALGREFEHAWLYRYSPR